MNRSIFGIDASKEEFHVAVLLNDTFVTHVFKNNFAGFREMIKWGKKQVKDAPKEWLFCCERGTHSYPFLVFANEKGLFLWLESPILLERAQEIDCKKIDGSKACIIATYASRFQDRAKATILSKDLLDELHLLMKYWVLLIEKEIELDVLCKEKQTVNSVTEITKSVIANYETQIAILSESAEELLQEAGVFSED